MEYYYCKQRGHIKFTGLSWYDTGPGKQHKDSHTKDFEIAQKIASQGPAQNPPLTHKGNELLKKTSPQTTHPCINMQMT